MRHYHKKGATMLIIEVGMSQHAAALIHEICRLWFSWLWLCITAPKVGQESWRMAGLGSDFFGKYIVSLPLRFRSSEKCGADMNIATISIYKYFFYVVW